MAKQTNNLLTWIFGIGIAIMMIFVVGIGTDLFYKAPDYQDYCTGQVSPQCDMQTYDKDTQSYAFNVYLIFSIVGMVLVIVSLLSSLLFIEIAGLIAGFGLMIMGIGRNFDNKIAVFISSIVILGLLIFVGYRKFKMGRK
jgi:hypothetical protein